MSALFDALPGIEVPVGEISRGLANLWSETAARGGPAPAADDSTATQVNLVLHFGLETEPEDAAAQFRVVESFARRYPSRIVVLCPRRDDPGGTEVRAKVYGECFLGRSKSDQRCVEFVLLSYSQGARLYLENQVSICLSTDLPLYYWAHRFSASGRLADYRYLLTRAKRVILDRARSPADALSFAWPNPAGVRDLACARLLPVRQTIGQFLAGYAPAILIDGLEGVALHHGRDLAAEGAALLEWLRSRLADCGADGSLPLSTAPLPAGEPGSFTLRFDYRGPGRHFRWRGDVATGQALFEADLGRGSTRLPAVISLLPPDAALAEAMFF